MHATIEQLLSARDGAAQEAAIARHIAECARCRAALDDLVALRAALETPHDDAPLVVLARTSPYQGMEILEERYPHLHYVRFKDEAERDRYRQQLTLLQR